MYHRVMICRKFGEYERSVEFARRRACHYKTWTKKEKVLRELDCENREKKLFCGGWQKKLFFPIFFKTILQVEVL